MGVGGEEENGMKDQRANEGEGKKGWWDKVRKKRPHYVHDWLDHGSSPGCRTSPTHLVRNSEDEEQHFLCCCCC